MNETNLIEDLRLLAPPTHGWLVALAALGLVGLGFALFLRRAGTGIRAPLEPAGAGAPLWESVLAELERLAPLLRPDRSREYGIAATTVLRRYVEARYALRAPRLTTEEFLQAAAASPALPPADRQQLGRFLELCDLCKFGRFVAAAEELRELQAAAVAFVLRSRPEPAAGALREETA